MIVGPQPLSGNLLDLLNAFENVQVQPFVPDRAIVALDISVLLRFPGLDMGLGDAPVLCPFHQGATDVFRAVVHPDRLRGATPFDDLVVSEQFEQISGLA